MSEAMTSADSNPGLSIAAWEPRSVANGPGERFVLWLQGCPFRCPDCCNDEFLEFRTSPSQSISEMLALITSVDGIEGVTFSGGEPMSQARGLSSLSQALRRAGLTVFCYTGFTLEELRAQSDPWIDEFLQTIDVLVDGRFVRDRKSSLLWRGSDNQQVHFLTDRYRHMAETARAAGGTIELISGTDRLVATGVLDQEILTRLHQVMRQQPLTGVGE